MTIGDLEKRAGIQDRDAFWEQFSHIRGTVKVNGKECDKGLEAGLEQLRWMASQRATE